MKNMPIQFFVVDMQKLFHFFKNRVADFAEKGKDHPVYARLAGLCAAHNGLWSVEAENYLLAHANEL